jgi:hypothetical protein
MGKGRGREVLLSLTLALAPLLAFAPAWRSGRLLAPDEGTALHLPLRVEAWRALGRREMPSWNPSSFSGTPLLAAYRPGAFHPLMAALTVFPPGTAFQLLVLASFALVGPVVYALARRLGAEPVGAFVAGLGFALGPYLVAHLGDTATIVAAPALPLVLLAVESHLERARFAATTLLAVAVALLLLAGSKDAVAAAALLLGVRLLAFAGEARDAAPRRKIAAVLFAVAVGVLLAAPQLVPTLLALRAAGPADAGMETAVGAPLAGIAGFAVRYVSHTPAPVFALAAVPLLAARRTLRVPAAVVVLSGAGLALRSRLDTSGPVPLAFDFALAVLAGLSFSAQWTERRTPHGRRLRLLAAGAALCAAGALSVATTVTGPVSRELAAPVGLLALALILYFRWADSNDGALAHVFLLPLLASFLLQPSGREAWGGAPSLTELEQGSPTRIAIDRVMGPRRGERILTLAQSWPRTRVDDLAWGNLSTFAGRRSANGYDPLVPAARLAALDGMRTDGTLPRSFFETDPGRLELLGVRWVQTPTEALAVAVDADGLGDAINVIIDPAHAHLFALPFTPATEVRFASFLAGATAVVQGQVVAECVVRLASGREISLPLGGGGEVAGGAIYPPDVRGRVRHERARVLRSFPVREGFLGHEYLGVLPLPGRFTVVALRFRALPGAPPLSLLRLGLRDAETGRARGVSIVSGYLSDQVRLAEAAGTPRVTLFEVRRGLGPARVVEALRRVPDARHVADLLRSPTRLGVDSRREALADAHDVVGVTLPSGSRASPAVVARSRAGRLVVRAVGPGLLVVTEGWSPGWTASLDGVPARVLRVNGDRLAVVLGAGAHRLVLRYRGPGLRAGVALAALGVFALVLLHRRERRARLRHRPPAAMV